jgi:Flp pilus assembly protein TadG
VNRFRQDCNGAVLVETTLVLLLFLLVSLGTVDAAFLLYDWAQGNKAAFFGARTALVIDPVATGITNLTYSTAATQLGQPCFASTGAPNGTSSCPTVNTVCTPAATNGSCTGGETWNEAAFAIILAQMQTVFPRLGRQNVQISYQTTGLGFVGRPNGLPMNVTVSIRCMTHQFFFLSALNNNLVFPALPTGCPAAAPGPALPPFPTTLTSESMASATYCTPQEHTQGKC